MEYKQYAAAREMHPDKSAKELLMMRHLDGLHALRERSIRRNSQSLDLIDKMEEIKRLGAKDFKKAKEFCDKLNEGELRLKVDSDITIGEYEC